MLGHVVARFLAKKGHEIITSEQRFEGGARDLLVETVRDSGCEWVVNALGRTKQKSSDMAELIRANAELPLHLISRLRTGQRLIHASTDCVFSGEEGNYAKSHERNAADDYGWSKILGETAVTGGGAVVIRTSIIGPEMNNGANGLLGWFLNQTGEVRGFTNHLWNGITTLEWAKIAAEVIEGGLKDHGGLIQAGAARTVSKYELLRLIATCWERTGLIHETEAGEAIDRTMVAELERPEIGEQLGELRAWYEGRGEGK